MGDRRQIDEGSPVLALSDGLARGAHGRVVLSEDLPYPWIASVDYFRSRLPLSLVVLEESYEALWNTFAVQLGISPSDRWSD